MSYIFRELLKRVHPDHCNKIFANELTIDIINHKNDEIYLKKLGIKYNIIRPFIFEDIGLRRGENYKDLNYYVLISGRYYRLLATGYKFAFIKSFNNIKKVKLHEIKSVKRI
jgi:hypothetical protein